MSFSFLFSLLMSRLALQRREVLVKPDSEVLSFLVSCEQGLFWLAQRAGAACSCLGVGHAGAPAVRTRIANVPIGRR